jgi:hypothetical protein
MFVNRRTPAFSLALWCLLSLWIFFGCLELAEQLHFVSEIVAEDQEHQDQDEEALFQLASGLKSNVPSLGAPCCVSLSGEVSEPAFSISLNTVHQLQRLMLHGPSSLPLYQRLSVYRI